MISIIDYGAGNLHSVKNALDFLGAKSEITADRDKILSASHVILPGVGAFGDAMRRLDSVGLTDTVRRAADGSRPFLGICLGLQLFLSGARKAPTFADLAYFAAMWRGSPTAG